VITYNRRVEQRKCVKFNHLVANCLIFYNVHVISEVLEQLNQEGAELDEQVVGALSPYLRQHIDRFGEYQLDLTQPPPALNYDIQLGGHYVLADQHSQSSRNSSHKPEKAEQILEDILEGEAMDEEDRNGERAGQGKCPGCPGGDKAESAKHEADEYRAQQMADYIDEQVDCHDWIAVEVGPERSELCGAAKPVDIISQGVQAHERGPGNPPEQGEGCRERGQPGRAPHPQQRHAQVAQGEEEGGGERANEMECVAGRPGHRTGQ